MGETGGPDPENDGRTGEEASAGWPVALGGVTETVTTTRGPGGRWNAAALGVHAPGAGPGEEPERDVATARTWGRTRTRRNFEREGGGHVQFVADPVAFVEAALGIVERSEPVLESAAAVARVEVERVGTGESRGTRWADWALTPVASSVRLEAVPTINRGFGAVVEASVWASRLDVAGYDSDQLRERIGFLEEVTRSCGGERERAAFDRLVELSDY